MLPVSGFSVCGHSPSDIPYVVGNRRYTSYDNRARDGARSFTHASRQSRAQSEWMAAFSAPEKKTPEIRAFDPPVLDSSEPALCPPLSRRCLWRAWAGFGLTSRFFLTERCRDSSSGLSRAKWRRWGSHPSRGRSRNSYFSHDGHALGLGFCWKARLSKIAASAEL